MKLESKRLLLGAGAASFLVFLVTGAPATLLGPVLGAAGMEASGLTGTVWAGEARAVQAGALGLDEVRWRTHPSRLLLGQLAADVAGNMPDGFLSGSVAVHANGDLVLRELQAATPLAGLVPGTAPGSQASLQMAELGLADGWITTARGTVRLAGINLEIPGTQGNPGTTGSFEVSFDAPEVSPEAPLTGMLTDTGGPLEFAGTVVLTPPRNYELSGKARARPGAPSALVDGLRMAGPRDGEGRHEVSLAGSF